MSHSREDDTYPRLASPVGWVPDELLGATVEAIVTTATRLRQPGGPPPGPAEVHDRRPGPRLVPGRGGRAGRSAARRGAGPLPAWRDSDEHLGWSLQPDGRWFLGVHVDSGRVLDGDDRRGGRPAQRPAGGGRALRAGGAPHRPPGRAAVRHRRGRPRRRGIGAAPPRRSRCHGELRPLRRLAMACPALPTCGQALGEAERVMPELVDGVDRVLDDHGLGELPLRINVTGCPNGCARPYTAEVGIVGRTKTHLRPLRRRRRGRRPPGRPGGPRRPPRAICPPPWPRSWPATGTRRPTARASATSAPGWAPSRWSALVPTFERRRGRAAPAEAEA